MVYVVRFYYVHPHHYLAPSSHWPLLLPPQLLPACLCSQIRIALDARYTVGELFFNQEVEDIKSPSGYDAMTCLERCLAL